MQQQYPHEEEITPRQEMRKATGRAHGPTQHQISQVVRVPGETPPAGSDEQGLVSLPISGGVGAADVLGGFAPDLRFAVGGADEVFLVIAGAEKGIAREADGEDKEGGSGREVEWVAAEILDLKGVHYTRWSADSRDGTSIGWRRLTIRKESGIAPGQGPAKVIVGDVNGPQVPIFVVEEVEHVEEVEEGDEEHGLCDVAELLVLIGHPREVTGHDVSLDDRTDRDSGLHECPGDDSWSTIVEELEVPFIAKSRIELDAAEVIEDDRAGKFAIERM